MTEVFTSGSVAGESDDAVLSFVGRRRLVVPGMATLRRWGGAWAAGTYAEGDIVQHKGLAWVSVVAGNTSEPGTDANWIERA